MSKTKFIIAFALIATAAFAMTLEEAIARAIEANSEMVMAKYDADATHLDVKSAFTGFLPRITADASYTRLDEVPVIVMPEEFAAFMPEGGIAMGDDDNYNVTLGVQQPIFMGGKIYYGYKAARAGAEIEKFNYNSTCNSVATDVAGAFFGVVKAELFRNSMLDARERMDAHQRVIEAMYEQGLISRNDLLKTRVASSEIDLMLIQSDNAVNAARLGLNFLLNYPSDSIIALDPDTTVAETPLPNLRDGIESAMIYRPDIRMMESAVDAANAGVAISRGLFLPDIVGVFNYSYQRPDRANEPEFYDSWNATIAASWSLLSWGDRVFGIRKAKLLKRGAQEGSDMIKRAAEMEIRNNLNSLREITQRLEVSRTKLEQTEEGYRVAHAEFGTGLVTNTDVLDANSALIQAQSEYISAVADFKVAQIKYEVATGKSFKE